MDVADRETVSSMDWDQPGREFDEEYPSGVVDVDELDDAMFPRLEVNSKTEYIEAWHQTQQSLYRSSGSNAQNGCDPGDLILCDASGYGAIPKTPTKVYQATESQLNGARNYREEIYHGVGVSDGMQNNVDHSLWWHLKCPKGLLFMFGSR
jgi:hypothetical protein